MEIERKTYKIRIDKYGYVRTELLGDQTEKDLIEYREDIVKFCQTAKSKKFGILDVGKANRADMKARKIYFEIGKMKLLDKVAVFGGSITRGGGGSKTYRSRDKFRRGEIF